MIQAAFLTALDVEAVDDRRWRLLHNLQYLSVVLPGVVTVPKGFVTDFASVPRWLLAGDTAREAAAVHDFLYQERTPLPRRLADRVFMEAMTVTGVSRWRRTLMYAIVRFFGWRRLGHLKRRC